MTKLTWAELGLCLVIVALGGWISLLVERLQNVRQDRDDWREIAGQHSWKVRQLQGTHTHSRYGRDRNF